MMAIIPLVCHGAQSKLVGDLPGGIASDMAWASFGLVSLPHHSLQS